ncbi:cytochrome P450 [Xylariomycetidae sp. FL2044]|nr:cytochrome P450 [Xylariomycetidae sp. FL2044]
MAEITPDFRQVNITILVAHLELTAAFNSLRHVPGPWYSRWTGIILKLNVVGGRKAMYIHSLHLKYGGVVRISPTETDVSDITAVHQIHSVKSDFRKTDWYRSNTVNDDNVFNTSDPAVHRRQRRLLSSPISDSGLKSCVPAVDRKARLFAERIGQEMETHGAADVYKWANFMTADVIAELTFGESFYMLEKGEKSEFTRNLESAIPILALSNFFPFVRYLLNLGVPVPGFKKAYDSINATRTSAKNRLERHAQLVESGSTDAVSTLFTKLHAAGEQDLSPEELTSNAQIYIMAGSDTTANSLTFLIWAVCRHPEVKSRLLAELDTLPDGFTYDDVRKLTYLNCIIDETLRLYSAVPSTLPRTVPPAGATLGGYRIEGGTVVSTQAYTLHRDSALFPDPETFDPSRWQNASKAMRDGWMPFGGGSRVCIGLYLAMMELRLATAHFFRQFPNARVSSREDMSDADMEQLIFFLMFPKGRRCLVETS